MHRHDSELRGRVSRATKARLVGLASILMDGSFWRSAVIATALASATLCSSCSGPTSEIAKAANNGDSDTVRTLLKSNSYLASDKDLYDTTPLHWAAQKNHKDIAELLLASGADVNARNKYGDTPLHFAASAGSTDVARLLLDHGAEIDVVDKPPISETPLQSAASHGFKDIVELIRQHGGR